MNIKKQIRTLYIYEMISGLQIVDLVWILFLIQRGFSLAEAGIAEGVFHVVSMCCEIPSGMLSDLIGRKKTLAAAGIVSALSAFCMIATDFFPMILLAMGLNALSYNLVSGTREALTYDSLLEAGAEDQYLKVSSRQESIYQGLYAVTGLISVITVSLGYRLAYLLAVGQGLLCTVVALQLKEAGIRSREKRSQVTFRTMGGELLRHFQRSARFLMEHPKIRERMVVSGGISAGCYLVSMILQEHLAAIGLDERLIGIPLFFISLFSVAGAVLGERTRNLRTRTVVMTGGCLAGIAVIFSGGNHLLPVIVAAGAANCMNEMTALRLENENQREAASEIRATIISVGSMMYSVWMAVLSPVCGAAANAFSVPAAFFGLGILMIVLTCIYTVREK